MNQPRYSASLLMAWQVADLEARRLHAGFLEPAHLLLGLCKCADMDVLASVPESVPERAHLLEELLREFRRLREVFRSGGLDASRFRRHYRTVLPLGTAGLTPTGATLHRNDAARDVFRQAEQLASVSGGTVYPFHLLGALLLEEDSPRKEALAAVGTSEAQVRSAVRRCVLSPRDADSPAQAHHHSQWN